MCALVTGVQTCALPISVKAPLLLVIEDVHWADQSTRDLISFLISRPFTNRVAGVLSYRGEDLHRRHPLRRQVAEWRSEESRVGKECVSTCRYRVSTDH